MDENIKLSVKARYDSFFNAYEINDEIKKDIDNLFEKINDFAKTCSDVMDFETKFASSKLNEEYTNLFVKVSQTCKMKKIEHNDAKIKSNKEQMLDDVASDAKLMMEDLTMPARRKARTELDSKLRDTPLGEIEQASNMFHLFKKFGKKNKPEQIDNEN